ncbi:uncharacterized protein RAG0_15225 [Rhynchosporium agropyri]|uniref:Ecp2 effector protein-like domain-containing protein n=1 Tax=Rhynchosporium agropyri TaxID=914238 RepID=A0A1E1LKB8_9HELO|nr:uncharacterized protein RAG0_15225 [Rhynchosporium agropyri]
MITPRILCLSALALIPLAAAAPSPAPFTAANADQNWTPVDFKGHTIYINNAAIIGSAENRAIKVFRGVFGNVGPDSDTCQDSSFDPHPAPFANTADCQIISDWAATVNTFWEVWGNTDDFHPIVRSGNCVFISGTKNVSGTWIGSTDIKEIISAALTKLQYNGNVAAQGEMPCDNGGLRVLGQSKVRWAIKQY